VGQNINFSSAGSNDSDGNIVSYSWTFGDGGSSNNANPSHSYAAAGIYTVRLTVTDNDGDSDTATTTATIADNNPPANVAPTANANGPYSGTAGQSVSFSSAGSSDSDGNIVSYSWNFGDGGSSNNANPSHTYGAAGSYNVSLTVTDNDGASDTDATTATIADNTPPQNCDPAGTGTHEGCIGDYTGPEVCVSCHEGEARDMHASVHYQQNGPTDFVTNINGLAGERGLAVGETGINTYCGTHENSPRFTCAGCHVGNGRFPTSTAEFNTLNSAEQLTELANVDCLMCHQEAYKRFPDPSPSLDVSFEDLVLMNVDLNNQGSLVEAPGVSVTRTGIQGIPIVDVVTLDFQFVPADPTNPLLADLPANFKMSMTALEAAQSVHPTTRKSCLNCHGGAGGGDGTKRGDLSSLLASPTVAIDQHMSPQNLDMTCSDCHSAGNHEVRGRGLDLRPNDVSSRFTCDSCHGQSPHPSSMQNASRFNTHARKVACQTCHIPTYAKGVDTEVSRDWQDPHVSQTACNGRGGWLPREDKAGNLIPSYAWFDGTSEVYYLGENLSGVPTVPLPSAISSLFRSSAGSSAGNFDTNDPAYVLGAPVASLAANGSVDLALGASDSNAKIYPMKEHWGKLARNTRTNTLVGHSTYEFFRTGDFDLAVREGLAQSDGMNANDGYTVVPVHTFQTINHGVEQQGNALGVGNQCGDCHDVGGLSGGPARLDLKGELGYSVDSSLNWSSNSNGTSSCNPACHGSESQSFTGLHSRSQHVSRGCRACHDQISGR
jgi:PKD repeat protein